jgi:ribonuclease BN (tRNA processing enzyme)
VRITVLGGCGAWPAAGQACSGYLVEHGGFRLLVDPGYAILPRLLERVAADSVDAVLVSHGHPDHCADLHPLLRARVLGAAPAPVLPVHALPGAVDRVLDLDGPGAVRDGAAVAGARRLLLTHLLPGTVPERAERAARQAYAGELAVARGNVVVDLS